jgi:hypothetical protein
MTTSAFISKPEDAGCNLKSSPRTKKPSWIFSSKPIPKEKLRLLSFALSEISEIFQGSPQS